MINQSLKSGIGSLFITLWLSGGAYAHTQWLKPSEFNVALNEGSMWIDVDMSVAERVFDVERPLDAGSISVVLPNGNRIQPSSVYKNHVRTNFELELRSHGTYKIDVLSGPVVRQRPAPKLSATAEDVPVKRPTTKMVSRLVSYITADAPSDKALSVTGEWLEFLPISHPADMVAGEPIKFKLLFNGKPLANSEVVIMPAASRYKNKNPDHIYQSNEQGEIDVIANTAGVFALKGSFTQILKNDPEAEQLRAMSYLIFEAQVN